MIKTQTRKECRVLRGMLPQYVDHLTNYPNSLLVRFYGMHRVKMRFVKPKGKIYFIVMSSVFDSVIPIHLKYDLKGSTIGRITDEKDCQKGHVQKDLNLVNSGRKLYFAEYCITLRETLTQDSHFLAQHNIMDYSLLVGIHDGNSRRLGQRHKSVVLTTETLHSYPDVTLRNSKEVVPSLIASSVWRSYRNGFRSANRESKEVYFLGIIDILQEFNTKKKAENVLRGMRGEDRTQISAVAPDQYADRFTRFLMQHTDEDCPISSSTHYHSSSESPGSSAPSSAYPSPNKLVSTGQITNTTE